MSNNSNVKLFEQASEVGAQFLGTGLDLQIEQAITKNDLRQLAILVKRGQDLAEQFDYQVDDYPTEEVEATDVY